MTVSKYARLASLPNRSEQQYKALAMAINLDLSLPNLYLDLCNGKAANDSVVTLLGRERGGDVGQAIKAARVQHALHQKYAVPTDTPQSSDVAHAIVDWYQTGLQELDLGWTNLYRLVDLRSTNQPAFDINTGTWPVTFKQRAPGEKIEIARIPAETNLSVPYVTYGAGVGIQDDWLRYNKWWNVEEVVGALRLNAWNDQAAKHYGLLTGLGNGINFAHIAGDDLGTETLNAAAADIYRKQLDKGTGVSASTPLWIVTSPEKRGYILRMLEATQGSVIIAYQNGIPLSVTVAGVIATTYVAANDTGYYLVLPQRRLARGNWQDLQIETQRDIYKRAQDWVGTLQYNAIVADTDQVRRVLFA
ncbi:hypothetical protein [Pseudoxanthomonas sp. USHLN014]|uniref:phage major capsid protein n=1 Tax=Pseudoxanthomonas sp. USHLN014 TaxID=3081297 RepID=UPI00301CF8C1